MLPAAAYFHACYRCRFSRLRCRAAAVFRCCLLPLFAAALFAADAAHLR